MIWRLLLKIIGADRIWKHYKQELIGHYHKEIHSPVLAQDLKFAFADLEGRKYYQFPHDQALPVERLGKLEEFLTWIGAGLSGEQLDTAVGIADKLLSEGLQKGKNAAAIGAILQEIKMRRGGISPIDLFYNYLAVQYIREDENPKTYNQNIQAEKVEAFKRGAATADSFFFAPELLRSLSSLLTSPSDDWDAILSESVKQAEIFNAKMNFLGSMSSETSLRGEEAASSSS